MDPDKQACELCGVSFWSEQRMSDHYETSKHKFKVQKKTITSLLDIDPDAENHHVYCIVISPVEDDRKFYYVGMTNDLVRRINSHKRVSEAVSLEKSFPSEDGKRLESKQYEFVRFVDVETYETREQAKLRERQKVYEVAQEYETNMILGGR